MCVCRETPVSVRLRLRSRGMLGIEICMSSWQHEGKLSDESSSGRICQLQCASLGSISNQDRQRFQGICVSVVSWLRHRLCDDSGCFH